MKKVLIIFLIPFLLFAQDELKFQGVPIEVVTTLKADFPGQIIDPQFAPFPEQVFSFVRKLEDNRYLYIYDIPEKTLREIRPQKDSDLKISVEEDYQRFFVLNTQFSWRPKQDNRGRTWFAFTSNGIDNNGDIYLGNLASAEYLRLTRNPAVDYQPAWSPDGNALAFLSTRSGNGDIYLLENINEIIAGGKVPEGTRVKRITYTAYEEKDLAWHPDPNQRIIAYTKREFFSGRDVPAFQIRVLDLNYPERPPLQITNDPLWHFFSPQWDPRNGNRLLFSGRSLQDKTIANLYLSELGITPEGEIKNRYYEGSRSELIKGIDPDGTAFHWLAGGNAVLVARKNTQNQGYFYTLNIQNWEDKREGIIRPFRELSEQFPETEFFDVRKNTILFVTSVNGGSRGYLAQIYGPDISPYLTSDYTFPAVESQQPAELPREGRGESPGVGKYLIAGGAVTAGVITYLLFGNGSSGDGKTVVPIGRPPSMP